MNAGRPRGQLSACFVLPVEDSLDKIFDTLKHAALIQQSGGGTGFDFSQLRPQGSWIGTTGGSASGPVSFMKIFDCATRYIRQGGKRRGANMGILNASHPDIADFITCKNQEGNLVNFNLSVAVEDEFMHALQAGRYWDLTYPVNGKKVGQVKADSIWQQLLDNIWQHGDPGLLFLNRIRKDNPTPQLGDIAATNPCGEMPLLPYECCNLGSINLSLMVKNVDGKPEVNWELLEEVIFSAVRFLDNVIDANQYPLIEIQRITQGNRKIGLGVMGWAEMLIKLKIPYASNKAVNLAESLMKFIKQKSRLASEHLAKSRGPFPNWPRSVYARQKPIRNATRTSIAPTGTISIIADTSSSIEPLYALGYQRKNILGGESQVVLNKLFVNYLEDNGLHSESVLSTVRKTGNISRHHGLPDSAVELFRTSLEIPFEFHIKHQIAFQKYTDNAVSKTINVPNDCGRKEISQALIMAWQSGAKGITIFRSGCRLNQVLNQGIPSGTIHPHPQATENPCVRCS